MRLLPQARDGEAELLVQLLQFPARQVPHLDVLEVMPALSSSPTCCAWRGERLLVIWVGSPIHRREAVKEFVTRRQPRTRCCCGRASPTTPRGPLSAKPPRSQMKTASRSTSTAPVTRPTAG